MLIGPNAPLVMERGIVFIKVQQYCVKRYACVIGSHYYCYNFQQCYLVGRKFTLLIK